MRNQLINQYMKQICVSLVVIVNLLNLVNAFIMKRNFNIGTNIKDKW
jgi:hypothetical protein